MFIALLETKSLLFERSTAINDFALYESGIVYLFIKLFILFFVSLKFSGSSAQGIKKSSRVCAKKLLLYTLLFLFITTSHL